LLCGRVHNTISLTEISGTALSCCRLQPDRFNQIFFFHKSAVPNMNVSLVAMGK
jgi:hypothetical protein